jgi:hypothetical protein
MITTDYDTKQLAQKAIAALTTTFDLVFTDYRDELTNRQAPIPGT